MMRARKKVEEQAAEKQNAVSLPPLFKDSEIEELNKILAEQLEDVSDDVNGGGPEQFQVVKNMIGYFHESTNKESTNKSGSKKKRRSQN